jgi:hypothetical protein
MRKMVVMTLALAAACTGGVKGVEVDDSVNKADGVAFPSGTYAENPPNRGEVIKLTLNADKTFTREELPTCVAGGACPTATDVQGTYKFTRADERRYIRFTVVGDSDRYEWQLSGETLSLTDPAGRKSVLTHAEPAAGTISCTITRPSGKTPVSISVGADAVDVKNNASGINYEIAYDPATQTATLTAENVSVTGRLADGQPLMGETLDNYGGADTTIIECATAGIASTVKPVVVPKTVVCVDKKDGTPKTDTFVKSMDGTFGAAIDNFGFNGSAVSFTYDGKTGQLNVDTEGDSDSNEIALAQGIATKDAPLGINHAFYQQYLGCYVE